jgi:hypothetical protein
MRQKFLYTGMCRLLEAIAVDGGGLTLFELKIVNVITEVHLPDGFFLESECALEFSVWYRCL